MYNYQNPAEVSYIGEAVRHSHIARLDTELVTSNFQDIYSLTKRVGEVEVKMNKLKFRAQGIGGMIGVAAGALGGPLGSVIGFGIGRAVGNFIGGGLAKKYYGEEQAVINENLFMARQRDSQLKLTMGVHKAISSLVTTLRQNNVNDNKKVIQDMIVL